MKDPAEDMLCLQNFDETVADFYRIEPPNVPWGGYGDVLVHGMTGGRPEFDESPNLLRTGPFVPPISYPMLYCLIVTEIMRDELQSSGLTGFSFVPARKKHIVPINWHEWDLFGEEPECYPEDGDPESYFYNGKHSPKLARSMPSLWRMVVFPGATEIREPEGVHYGGGGQIFLRAASLTGADFFLADTTYIIYVSALARQWLLDRYPAWIAFSPVKVK